MSVFLRVFAVFVLCFGAPASPASAQEGEEAAEAAGADSEAEAADPDGDSAAPDEEETEPVIPVEIAATMRTVVQQIAGFEEALAEAASRKVESPEDGAAKLEEIADLEEQLETARGQLARLITGLDPSAMDSEPEETIAWEEEARELLAPVVSQLRRVTVRPRRIEQLRARKTALELRLPQVIDAIVKTSDAAGAAESPAGAAELSTVKTLYIAKKQEIEQELQLLEAELVQLEGERAPLLESGRAVVEHFFKNRGKNALTALAALLLVVFLARLLQQSIGRAAARREGRAALALRLVELIVLLGGVIAGVGAMVGVLYTSGDWVLLTLAIIAFLAVLWSTRNGLPRFWREIQVLLNVGSIRQNERIVFDGLPWRIVTLHLITVLDNPAFPGAVLRLPLGAIIDGYSRPTSAGERWFPTDVGDWVVWDDAQAQVKHQSPESVLLIRDASEVLIPTPDFVAAAPVNISTGFRHRVTVTFDYAHQKEVTDAMPKTLARYVEEAIRAHEFGEHLTGLGVDFEAAGASSLDVEIEADFAGAAAERWEELLELVQKASVDACNAENWEIALPQLRLHRAD